MMFLELPEIVDQLKRALLLAQYVRTTIPTGDDADAVLASREYGELKSRAEIAEIVLRDAWAGADIWLDRQRGRYG